MKENSRISKIMAYKIESVNYLIEEINKTYDNMLRHQLIFILIDNFKDSRIIPTLISLIRKKNLKKYNSSYIYACNEYSPEECKPYIELFIEEVIKGSYESSWSSAQLILDFQEPFEWSELLLDKLEFKLEKALTDKENENKKHIQLVLSLIGGGE